MNKDTEKLALEQMAKMEALIVRVNNNDDLSYNETHEYCEYLNVTKRGLENIPQDICSHYIFKHIYLRYYKDLSFSSTYRKPNKDMSGIDTVNAFETLKAFRKEEFGKKEFNDESFQRMNDKAFELGLFIEIPEDEIAQDKATLADAAIEWSEIIYRDEFEDDDLKVIAIETKKTLRKPNRDLERGAITAAEFKDEFNRTNWKSKYIFYEAKRVKEEILDTSNFPYVLSLKGEEVQYNFDSLIHILNRHFAKMVSGDNIASNKSFHSPKITPNNIHLRLEEVFHAIEHIEELGNFQSEGLSLNYFELDYQLYFKRMDNGQLQVATFFPITKPDLLTKLQTDFTKQQLNENLYIYL